MKLNKKRTEIKNYSVMKKEKKKERKKEDVTTLKCWLTQYSDCFK